MQMEAGGDPAIVQMWENAAAEGKQGLQAIDPVLNLRENFPVFTVRNWNQEPVSPRYSATDATFPEIKPDLTVDTTLTGAGQSGINDPVQYLGARYYRYAFGPSVRAVTYENKLKDSEHGRVWAIARVGGSWRAPEDWSAIDKRTFCRPEEDIEELVLVISNIDWQGKSTLTGEKGTVKTSELGCTAWEGSAEAIVYYFNTRYRVIVDNMRFEHDPADTPGEGSDPYILVSSGPVQWQVQGPWATTDDCDATGTMTLDPPGSGSDKEFKGGIIINRNQGTYETYAVGHDLEAKMTITCPGSPPSEQGWPVISVIWDGGNIDYPIDMSTGSPRLVDDYHDPNEVYGGTWEWSFHPAQ